MNSLTTSGYNWTSICSREWQERSKYYTKQGKHFLLVAQQPQMSKNSQPKCILKEGLYTAFDYDEAIKFKNLPIDKLIQMK